MKNIARALLKLMACVTALAVAISILPSTTKAETLISGSPPTSFVIGISPHATGEAAEIVLDGILELALAAEKGTKFTIYDALKIRKITGFETPTGRSDRINRRLIKKEIKAISEYLDREQSIRVAKGNQVHLPGFLDSISSSVRMGGGGTRVVIFGSLFFTSDQEPSASFTEGFVPSPGHLWCSSYEGVYGTADKKGALAGVAVDICTLGYQAGAIEQRAVERFWGNFLSEQAAVLTTVEAYPDVLINRAASGVMDPVADQLLDRTDIALEIRPAISPQTPPPTPPPSSMPKASPLNQGPISTLMVDMAIVVDGSASMDRKLPVVREMIRGIADLTSRITKGYRLLIEIYRQIGNTSSFPMTPIGPPVNKQPSFGGESLVNFLDNKTISMTDSNGKQTFVSHFQGQSTAVDVEGALMRGIQKLEQSGGDRMILVLIGDCGPVEMDGSADLTDSDRAAIQRTLAAVRLFVDSHSDVRVLSVFTGNEANTHESTRASVKFYKDFAALAGSKGVYTADLEGIEILVSQAVLGN